MTMPVGRLPAVATQHNRSLYRPSKNAITEMQRRFVDEYMIDLNGTQAAIRAGFLSTKATSASASMLKFVPVREEIARRMASRSARVGLNADRVLFELGKLVVGDTRSVFNDDGTLKKPTEMDEYASPLIAGVKTRRVIEMGVDENGKPTTTPVEMQEVKLVDRISAITLAMRHLGMMNDKLDINISSLADRMLAARLRLGARMPGYSGVTIDAAGDGGDQEELARQLLEYEQGLPEVELHEPTEDDFQVGNNVVSRAGPNDHADAVSNAGGASLPVSALREPASIEPSGAGAFLDSSQRGALGLHNTHSGRGYEDEDGSFSESAVDGLTWENLI